ncbi:unnamed protein product [Schistosoma curassoni]|uniref:Ovule protein n=1 Tax=Schistosoma curassoni TaxID=6186 RepID=A0A183JF38_9TREM|nr:unnamed protein product [Schistosoma curassoni]
MYLHLRVDIHSGTQTQYRSLQTPSRYPFSTVCTYANKRLINFSPKHQSEDSSKTIPNELRIL